MADRNSVPAPAASDEALDRGAAGPEGIHCHVCHCYRPSADPGEAVQSGARAASPNA